MIKSPLVSVIIPTFNRISFLKKALSSVLNQTFKNFEVIIVDNFSSDGTKEYLQNLADQRVKFFQINNEGIIAKSRNLGITRSSGDYIAFLDSDDWWNRDKLLKSINKINEGFEFIYHNVFLHQKKINKSNCKQIKYPVFDDLYCNGNPIVTSSVVVKKELLLNVDRMTENKSLIAAEDFDTWLKISKKTNKFFLIKECLGHYSVSKDIFSSNIGTMKELFYRCDFLIKKYSNDYHDDLKNIIWVDLLKAKYLSESGNFEKSNFYLNKLIKKNTNMNVKLKLILTFIKNYLKIK